MNQSSAPPAPKAELGSARRRSRKPTRAARASLQRYLLELPATWTPWLDFLTDVRQRLGIEAATGNDPVITTWRKVREPVLEAVDAGGLEVTVWRTDGVVAPLAEHPADRAGLVHVRAPGLTPTPGEDTSDRAAYHRRMAKRFGLTLCPELPRALREFCGQGRTPLHDVRPTSVGDVRFAVWCPYWPMWLERAAGWLDEHGRPVLTCETYDLNQQARAVVRDVQGLPLVLDAEPQPGEWGEGTSVLIWRWDPSATVLPAQFRPLIQDIYGVWFEIDDEDEITAMTDGPWVNTREVWAA